MSLFLNRSSSLLLLSTSALLLIPQLDEVRAQHQQRNTAEGLRTDTPALRGERQNQQNLRLLGQADSDAGKHRLIDEANQLTQQVVELYQQGRSKELRATQLEMLKNPRYQHPYYWAAFIPFGNWRPLR